MKTIFEKQSVKYYQVGYYEIRAIIRQKKYHIGVWANLHRRYLKHHHQIRYNNLVTSERYPNNLSDIEEQAENYFQRLVKLLTEQENVPEK